MPEITASEPSVQLVNEKKVEVRKYHYFPYSPTELQREGIVGRVHPESGEKEYGQWTAVSAPGEKAASEDYFYEEDEENVLRIGLTSGEKVVGVWVAEEYRYEPNPLRPRDPIITRIGWLSNTKVRGSWEKEVFIPLKQTTH